MIAEESNQLIALDQPAIERKIQKPHHRLQSQAACPVFQRAQLATDIGRAYQRTNRGAADQIWFDACIGQRMNYANMCPTARRAATECKTDLGAVG